METRNLGGTAAAVGHEVLSVVSHELRGPLGVARGYLRLLAQSEALDARSAKMLTDVQRATDRMTALLDEVSELARWARGEHTLIRTPQPLADLVTAAATGAALPHGPVVLVEVDAPADCTATVDRPPLVRALSSLIAAVVRAQVKDATITVVLRSFEPGHAVVRIAPRPLLDATSEQPIAIERAGAGLSLALAEAIVHRHGGGVVECWLNGEWAGYRCWL